MAEIVFNNVSKTYKGGVKAVQRMNLVIEDGDFVVLVGPSGCGKSTALRMVAGLEEISEGTVTINGKVVNNVDPGDRDIAMVFQNYALYPHMTVYDNIAFPLQSRKTPKKEVDRKVREIAGILGLEDYLKRKPKTLSGGQKQRVAMGRALVREPQAFLMDEPLSNLDAKLRVQMRTEICELQKKVGVTTLYVTHDQVEAMTMGSKIAVMRFGVLQQYATPQEVFDAPANIFVASFIGSPSMNFVKATVGKENDNLFLSLKEQKLYIDQISIKRHPLLAEYIDQEVAFGFRPEHITISEPGNGTLNAEIFHVELLGAEKLVYANISADPVSVEAVLAKATGEESVSDKELDLGHSSRIILKIDSQIDINEGQIIGIRPRTGLMHFFSLDTGLAIADS